MSSSDPAPEQKRGPDPVRETSSHRVGSADTSTLDRRVDPSGTGRLRLRLPATSANLGPGFDALGLALTLTLEVEATPSESFSLTATGRNADICSSMNGNLLLDTYRDILKMNGTPDPPPLAFHVHNGIPLGMGCGSSAAVRLAGVTLAAHFGGLEWDRDRILTEASLLEGHPDNTAACWLGGLTVAALENGVVHAATIHPAVEWRILLALPRVPLATTTARAALPSTYSREDSVANIQRVALLTAAFALGRGDLLRIAMQDRIHQPYRAEMCPLLPLLLPLAGKGGILGVALSGAGPGVLLIAESAASVAMARDGIVKLTKQYEGVEVVECRIENKGGGSY